MRKIRISYLRTTDALEEHYARFLARLEPEEQARAGRFVFARDRLAFALGRVLARRALSEYAPARAAGWRFVLNPYGRPELPPLPGMPSCRFSISHCASLVAVACALEHDIGIDVERIDRSCSDLSIARSYFTPQEFQVIQSQPPERRREVFFAYWTLKEAYIKARGMGLSIPLSHFSFTLDPPRIAFLPQIEDRPERWQFWRAALPSACQLAVAAVRDPGEQLDFSCEEVSLESLLARPCSLQ